MMILIEDGVSKLQELLLERVDKLTPILLPLASDSLRDGECSSVG